MVLYVFIPLLTIYTILYLVVLFAGGSYNNYLDSKDECVNPSHKSFTGKILL